MWHCSDLSTGTCSHRHENHSYKTSTAATTLLETEERWDGEREREEEERTQDDEGTHGWLNPSLETPSRRQGAHTFPSFSLQKRTRACKRLGSEVGMPEVRGWWEVCSPGESTFYRAGDPVAKPNLVFIYFSLHQAPHKDRKYSQGKIVRFESLVSLTVRGIVNTWVFQL